MKKTNFFKIVMTLVMAFVVTGAFAQWVPSTTEATDSVTVNVSVPYYVEPDSYFNPDFVAPDTDVVSTFYWTIPAGVTVDPSTDHENDNYVELTFGSTGGYTLSVTETAPSGGCAGTAEELSVQVIDSTTVAFNNVADGTYFDGTTDTTFCDGYSRKDALVAVDFTTEVNSPYSIQLQYTLEIMTYADNTTTSVENWWQADKTTSSDTQVFAVDKTEGSQETGINALTLDLDKAGEFDCVVDGTVTKKTEYKYTIIGVNDRISRKSDYLTNNNPAALAPWTWYDLTAAATPETFSITVLPAPVTGPIYHISNMWAN